MPLYTIDTVRYELSVDETGHGTSYKRVGFDTVSTGYTELGGITLDTTTNVGRINFSASAESFWDFFRLDYQLGPDDATWTDFADWVEYKPSHNGGANVNAYCRVTTGDTTMIQASTMWWPIVNSEYVEILSKAAVDTSWSQDSAGTYCLLTAMKLN